MMTKSGQIVWQGEYSSFGQVTESIDVVVNLLRFPGQYFDQESDLHYNYFRDYDPTIGRYTQRDPIGLSGGFNTYLYALGNPIISVDLDGRFVNLITGAIGAAVGAAMAAATGQSILAGAISGGLAGAFPGGGLLINFGIGILSGAFGSAIDPCTRNVRDITIGALSGALGGVLGRQIGISKKNWGHIWTLHLCQGTYVFFSQLLLFRSHYLLLLYSMSSD